MIAVRFGADALARVRFAISPLIESQLSVRVLEDPGAQALHLPWAADARRRTADLDLSVLRALQPDDVYSPDFVHPPPTSPLSSASCATPASSTAIASAASCSICARPPATTCSLRVVLAENRANLLAPQA
jgi:hypothetical protein